MPKHLPDLLKEGQDAIRANLHEPWAADNAVSIIYWLERADGWAQEILDTRRLKRADQALRDTTASIREEVDGLLDRLLELERSEAEMRRTKPWR